MTLVERWRKPVIPLEVNQHESEGVWLPDGRRMRSPVLTLRPEDVDRIRSGFVCAKCLEPFERPWPECCHVCGVAVRRDQAAFFAREYDPARVDLTATDWESEREGLEERRRKEEEG